VLYEEQELVGFITLNRPEKKNTLTDAVIQALPTGSIGPPPVPTYGRSCYEARAACSAPAMTRPERVAGRVHEER